MEEQITKLLNQWIQTINPQQSGEILKRVATLAGCLEKIPEKLTQQDRSQVLDWVDRTYPDIFQAATETAKEIWGLD